MSEGSGYTSQVVQAALQILEEVARQGETGVRDLARSVGMTHSKAHRLLVTLQEAGYMNQSEDTGRYRLSLKLFELGSQALRRMGLLEETRPVLAELAATTGETVMLSVREGTSVVFVDRIASSHPVQLVHGIGERAPLHGTASGKIFLAWMDPAERLQLLGPGPYPALATHTATTLAELTADLAVVRQIGYAVNDQERFDGIRSVAAPVFNHQSQPVAAVIAGGPTLRVSEADVPRLAAQVRAAGLNASRRLGYRSPI